MFLPSYRYQTSSKIAYHTQHHNPINPINPIDTPPNQCHYLALADTCDMIVSPESKQSSCVCILRQTFDWCVFVCRCCVYLFHHLCGLGREPLPSRTNTPEKGRPVSRPSIILRCCRCLQLVGSPRDDRRKQGEPTSQQARRWWRP